MKTTVWALSLLMAASVWADEGLKNPLKRGDAVQDGDEVALVGRIITQDETDAEGQPVTRAFLEQDDGGIVELPCERKDKDRGLARKATDKALGGNDSCWDYVGEEVRIIGSAQNLQKKGKRWLRVGRITGISPL